MAGDWIKMRDSLRDDPAVISIAHALGIDEDTVVGKLHRFWSWADQHTTDGNATGVTAAWLDRYVCATGFANALANAGWLLVGDSGLSIPRFDRHNGESAKERGLAAKRAAKYRAKSNANSNGSGVTSALPREEKRREEKSNSTPLPPVADEFVLSWNATAGTRHCRKITGKRLLALKARCLDPDWDWRAAIAKFPLKLFASEPGGWQPTLEWFLRPDTVTSILEGKYDWSKRDGKPAHGSYDSRTPQSRRLAF